MGSMRRGPRKCEKNSTMNVTNDTGSNEMGVVQPIVRHYATQNVITENPSFGKFEVIVTSPVIHNANVAEQ